MPIFTKPVSHPIGPVDMEFYQGGLVLRMALLLSGYDDAKWASLSYKTRTRWLDRAVQAYVPPLQRCRRSGSPACSGGQSAGSDMRELTAEAARALREAAAEAQTMEEFRSIILQLIDIA